jgi:hypothetical protein
MHWWGCAWSGQKLRGCAGASLWGNALPACHIDMLKAVAFLFACGLNVGMVVSWARQVCGWCFLGRGEAGNMGFWGLMLG